jgi:serine/threonine-protein kinase
VQNRPRLGKYRVVAELGHGGMADVYLAVRRGPAGFSKLEVVKLLRAELADQDDYRTMFLEEARIAARLSHPNIVQTHDVGEDAGRYYMAMEYLEGAALDRLQRRAMKDGGGIPEHIHLTMICEMLRGLHHAHELLDEGGMPLSIVHRDVSPHNLIVTYDGQVKLLDFGIAKTADSILQTRTGVLKGKITYMAPEQARAEVVDRRADLFAVGIMVWEAAAHARFWEGLTEIQVLHRISTGEFRDTQLRARALPPEVLAICQRALGPRESRYATAADMEAELAAYLGTPATPREIAEYVTRLFGAEKAKVRAKVDAQLVAMKVHDSERAVKSVSIDPLPLHTPSSGTPSASISDEPPLSIEPSVRIVDAPVERPTSVTLVGPPSATMTRAPRGWRIPALLAANAVLAVAVGWALARDSRPGPDVAPSSSVAVPSSSAPSAVIVRVRANPPDARLFIDDAPVANPFASAMPIDRSAHRVRAEAPDFGPAVDAFVLDGAPVTIELSLARTAVAAAPPASGKAATPGKAAPPAASGKPSKGGLSLDKDDPWAK